MCNLLIYIVFILVASALELKWDTTVLSTSVRVAQKISLHWLYFRFFIFQL